jgi:hypothetical protein
LVKPVGHPVQDDRVKSRVAKQDFERASSRRIFPEDGFYLFFDNPEHAL